MNMDHTMQEEWLGDVDDPVVAEFYLRVKTEDSRNIQARAKRVEMDVALDQQSDQYNDDIDSNLQIGSARLCGRPIEQDQAGLVVGMLDAGSKTHAAVAIPVAEVMPMRFLPHYFDKTKEQNKKNEGMDADDYEAKSQLQAVQVHIKRRETEQQQEARLRSYAYLTQQEDSERWLELKYKGCGDKASKDICAAVMGSARYNHVNPTYASNHAIGNEQYFQMLVPGTSSVALQNFNANAQRPTQSVAVLGKPVETVPFTIESIMSAEAAAALLAFLDTTLRRNQVLSLSSIRETLNEIDKNSVLHKAVNSATDAYLHSAVVSDGSVLCIRKLYVLRTLSDPAIDPLRSIILECLEQKPQIRKADIVEAASQQGIGFSDSLYNKIIKDLCQSRGSVWSLK